ncbi:MAG: hypothetical protein PPHEESC_1198 [uncultured Paraburkholderia sp.]|nr:MAG: hypothetical protein PPHEESC_1198 [uncultured Paraburkholderia sp.]
MLHDTVFHHGDAVAERHGFDLIVRHVDDRRAEALMQQLDFRAHLDTQLRPGSKAARRTETSPDRAQARGPWRRADAGRRTAGPACDPADA